MKLSRRIFVLGIALLVGIFTISQVSYAAKVVGDLRQQRGPEIKEDALAEDTGKTFVAVTAPGVGITSHERIEIDKKVRAVIGGAFALGHALRTGENVPSLEQQTDDKTLISRIAEANTRLKEAAKQAYKDPAYKDSTVAMEGLRWVDVAGSTIDPVRVVFLTDDDNPALLIDGDLHLIGSSGYFPTDEAPNGSHYVKLALIELAIPALGEEEGMEFLKVWVTHEAEVLHKRRYVTPFGEQGRILNEGYAKIREYHYQQQLAAVEEAREAELKKAILDVTNVRIGPHLATTGIPDEVKDAVEAVLASAKERVDIVAFRVLNTPNDLMVQVNHHQGPENPVIQQLIREASIAGLRAAESMRILNDSGQALIKKDSLDRAEGLIFSRGFFPMTERGADPMMVVKAINGGAGTFNRPLFRAFFSPDSHPAGRLGQETFRAVVERVEDIRQGKKDRIRYVFGTGDMSALMALIGDHTEWMITEVYAETGRFAESNPDEPVAKVIVEPITSEGFTEAAAEPTLVIRLQSGSEAIGTVTDALAKPWIAPGGANDAYHLTTIPVSWEQAKTAPQRGFIHLVAYGYMSYGEGRIPMEDEVFDAFAPVSKAHTGLLAKMYGDAQPELQTAFQLAQEQAHTLAQFMLGHGEMDPFLTARGAEHLSEATARSVGERWVGIPKTELSVDEGGERDPFVERANKASGGRTLSVIKADAGDIGHLKPPIYYSIASEVSLEMMKEADLVKDAEHFSVGDDAETLSIHYRGADDHEIHANAYQVFWRMVYLAKFYELVQGPDGEEIIQAKTYGDAQDLDLVSDFARGQPVPQLAGINDEVVPRMADQLRHIGRDNQALALEKGWEIHKVAVGQEQLVATVPFSGNITGQGPGFAEFALPPEGAVRLGFVGSDKTGPAAFNIPILWALEQGLARGIIQKKGGAIAVIDDTKGHKRIFLDVETEMDIIRGLSANPDRYNFKRVISKSKSGWDRDNWEEYVGDRYYISTSTEKLAIITGGEYRGKDDSVLLGDGDFGELLFEHARDHVYLTQGDAFGSHFCHPTPESLSTAVATRHSKAVQLGLWVDISADDELTFTDVYADPAYRQARRRSAEIVERVWDTQGTEFTPVGVGAGRVEPAYPLMKSIMAVTAPDSKFATPAHVDVAQSVSQGRWAGQFDPIGYQISPGAVRVGHDTKNPKVLLIHSDFFLCGPDGAIAIQRYLSELGFSSIDKAAESSAIKLTVAMGLPQVQNIEPSGDEETFDLLLWEGHRMMPSEHRSEARDIALTPGRILDILQEQFPEVEVEPIKADRLTHPAIVDSIEGEAEWGIRFKGPRAAEAVRFWLSQDEQARDLVSRVSQQRLQTLLATINEVSDGATHLKPEWFTVVTDGQELTQPVAAAIGSSEWMRLIPDVPVKVDFNAPGERDNFVVSAAAAFFAAIEAIAVEGHIPPDAVAQRLNIGVIEDDVMIARAKPINTTVEEALRNYQESCGGV